jgi:signal peptidase II
MPQFNLSLLTIWILADQLLKAYTVKRVPFYPEAIEVFPNLLSLGYSLNKGAAWSLFWGQLGWLTLLRFVVGVILIFYFLNAPLSRVQQLALSLVSAGAIGNAIDGLFRTGVVDMLILHPLTALYQAIFGNPFPIFNIADVGVVSGAILLIISLLFEPASRPRRSLL